MNHRLAPYAISLVILVLDRISKYWIETRVTVWDTLVVVPNFFNIVHTQNRGMAFGLFAGAEGPWRTVILIGLAVMVLVFVGSLLLRTSDPQYGHWRARLALSLVLGGAMGNLHDRIFRGGVTDFLEFYAGDFRWSAFNVADSAITTGALLLALELFRSRRAPVEA